MRSRLRFSARARPPAVDAENRTLRKIALRHRIVRQAKRIHSASTFLANARSSPGSATQARAPERRAGTFPRNRLPGREEREGKRLASKTWCVISLIARRKLRHHAE